MNKTDEAQIAKLMVALYVNTKVVIEKFATKDMIYAELASYDVKNIASRLIELAQRVQEEEKKNS